MLNRLRIIVFSIMVFGAFASFAHNEWGNSIAIMCQAVIAITFIYPIVTSFKLMLLQKNNLKLNLAQISLFCLSFISILFLFKPLINQFSYSFILSLSFFLSFPILLFTEFIFSHLKKQNREPIFIAWENFLLAYFFIGLYLGNLNIAGGEWYRFFCPILLIFFYAFNGIKFFINTLKSGVIFGSLILAITISAIFLCMSMVSIIQHLFFNNRLFYEIGLIFALVSLLFIKKRYILNKESVIFIKGVRLVKTNFIFIYIVLFVFSTYKLFVLNNIMPNFYSEYYPVSLYQLQIEGKDEKVKKLRIRYENFIEHTKNNAIVK